VVPHLPESRTKREVGQNRVALAAIEELLGHADRALGLRARPQRTHKSSTASPPFSHGVTHTCANEAYWRDRAGRYSLRSSCPTVVRLRTISMPSAPSSAACCFGTTS